MGVTMKRVVCFVLVICIAFVFQGCIFHLPMQHQFREFESTGADSVFAVYENNSIYSYLDDKVYLFSDLMGKGFHGRIEEVFTVQNETTWFCFSERDKESGYYWNIASINLDGSTFDIHYSGKFCSEPAANSEYLQCVDKNDMKASGFYQDNKIIITDQVKLVEFDIATQVSREYDAEEFVHKQQSAVQIQKKRVQLS
jgi:hypothetical protein